MSKKLLIFVFSLALVLLLCPAIAFGAEYVKLDDAIADVDGWTYHNKENIEFKDGSIVHKSTDTSDRPFGYKNKKFHNEILQFDAIFNVESYTKWQGIMLRAQNTETAPWSSNNNYLIVITEDYIELQRFNYGNQFLTVKPNPIKSGERVSVEFGAINTDKGVNLILTMNGKTVFNEIEPNSEKLLTEAGYFGLYNHTNITLLPYSGNDDPVPPSANLTSIKSNGLIGDSVEIDYNYADIEGGTEGESEYAWYRTVVNVDHYGVRIAQPKDFKERYMEKIEGATSRTYTVTEKDIGMYLRCGIRTRSKETGLLGEEVFTDSVKIELVDNILGNGVFFEKGNPYAVVNGERKKLDNEIDLAPSEVNGKFYVPLNFTAEALGYSVSWNGETKSCTVTKGDKAASVTFGNDFIDEQGRILVPVDRMSELFGTKSSYEPLYELGIINDLAAGLDPFGYKVLLRSIKKAINE